MSNVAVVAKLVAKEGRRPEMIEALRSLVAAAREEDGTLVYVLHEASGDEVTAWVYEMYADQDSLATHGASEAMKAVGGRLGDVLAGPPELSLARPLEAKGFTLSE